MLKVGSTLLLLVGLGFCIASVVRTHHHGAFDWHVTPTLILASVAASVGALLAMMLAWRWHLRAVSGTAIRGVQALQQVSAILIGKYVPIMIGGVLLRIMQNKEIRAGDVVAASILEQIGAVGAASIIGVALYLLAEQPWMLVPVGVFTSAAVWYAPILFVYLLKWISRLRRMRDAATFSQSRSDAGSLRWAIAWQIVQWIALAALVACVCAATGFSREPSVLLHVSAAYAFAVVVGIAAVFVPGGIGVREGVFVALCGYALPDGEALQLAFALRIVMSAFDGFAYVIDFAVRGLIKFVK